MPALRAAASAGSIALMSTRTGRSQDTPYGEITADQLASGYLTLATGSRAAAGDEAGAVFRASDPRSDSWAGFFGAQVPDSGLVAPWTQAARALARWAPYELAVGALGDALRLKGITSEVIGVADTADAPHREAALLVVGSDGLAPGTRLTGGTVPDPSYPFGVKTPVDEVRKAIGLALSRARLVVVETGDAARYERARADLLPAAREKLRARALASADAIAGAAFDVLPDDGVMLITSPGQAMDPEAAGAERLSPVLAFGKRVPAGLLRSGSTRRDGVVANTDIAATIAGWLGADGRIGSGQAMSVVRSTGHLSHLNRLYDSARYQDRTQRTVYVFVYGACAIALLAGMLLPGRSPGRRVGAALSLAPAGAFFGLLPLTHLQPRAEVLQCFVAACAAASAGISFAAHGRRAAEALAAISIAGVGFALLTNMLSAAAGSFTMQGGARFYGLGNEYGGFVVGAALFLAGSPVLQSRRWIGAAGLAALALACGHPALGANAGVMLGALMGCAALVAASLPAHQKRTLPLIVCAAAAMLAALAIADALRPADSQSHLGRAVASIAKDGPRAAIGIAQRKAELNLMLLGKSPWSLLLGICVAASALAERLARVASSGQIRARLTGPLWAGCLALGVFNDSGVLAAAACALWLMAAAALRAANPAA